MMIDDARHELFEKLANGESAICPCCDRYASRYKRTINGHMAEQLLKLYKAPFALHAKQIQSSTDGVERNYSLMKHWGLIDHGEAFATWLITEKGRQFVEGLITLPDGVFLYNNEPVGWSNKQVSFSEVVDRPFDKAEIYEKI